MKELNSSSRFQNQPLFDARIIILNWNGETLLKECLPSLIRANEKAKLQAPVTILDNLSTDLSQKLVREQFPEVAFVKAPKNLILCSYNYYLPQIQESVVILLNNDIKVEENFIPPLLEKFNDPDTFLAAPRVMSFDGSKIDAARTIAKMRFGLFWTSGRYSGYEKDAMTPSETFSSGFGAFSRKKFLELGGYDERFLPGIMEDADICFRAKKAGYKLYYEPKSVVYHMGQASFKKSFGGEKIKILAYRNNFLFMWKNFKSPQFWLSHLFFLPFRLLFSLLKGDAALLKGFVEALQVSR